MWFDLPAAAAVFLPYSQRAQQKVSYSTLACKDIASILLSLKMLHNKQKKEIEIKKS